MGERRKRKALWDKEAETNSFPGTSDNNTWTGKDQHLSQDSELYHEISASGSRGEPKFRDHSGKPYLESVENDPVAQMNGNFTKSRENAPEGNEIGSGNSYYQNMPPNFKHNQSLEIDRSHSRRYKVRGRSRSRTRSRSRSRSRTRGRRHSRSLSRGRERERERARGRSRSRSRSEGDARGRTESQYSGWSDRRRQHEKSTEICSDFSAGRCRRGSQCKYLHSKDPSHRDGGLGGADTSESWRSRTSHGNNSKQSYGRGPRAESKGDVSDSYAEDVQFKNKSKNAPPCKNFVIGKCRWGDTCRFSHHVASDEPSVEGSLHLSPDKDTEHQPYRNNKLVCNYFSAGKCDMDNCRFSHGDSKPNSLVGALGGHGKVIDENHSHDQGNKRNGLMRDDQGSTIDNYSTGHDNRWSHSLGNENTSWGLPQRTDNLVDKSTESVCRAGSGSYGEELGTTGSVSKENTTAKQELLTLNGSHLQNKDENMNVGGQNNLQIDQTVFVNTWHVSSVSHIQQQNHGVVENASFHSDNMDDVKGLKNATGPALLPGQNMHQNGENSLPGNSCISGESGSEQMPAFKGAEMHQVTNLNLQYLIQKHKSSIQMTGMPVMNTSQSFPSLAISEHSAQYTSAPLSNQRFENEHSGNNAVMEVSSSTGIPISISNASGHVPLNTVNTQFNPIEVSHEPINPMENGRSINENGHQLAEGNNRPAEPLPPTSIVGMEPNNSEVDHSGSSKLQQETPAENPEIDRVKRGTDEQRKGVQNSMHAETLDSHRKGDEIIANKDDKDIRLFKNSLIEFVKDILKPTWKEGRMSREVHKTIVKKVVDKITSTIQTDHIPKTQEKVEQYLSFSKPKIAKLVQAYVDRCLKTDS